MSDYFKELWDEIENGLAGKNKGLSMGFPRLGNYVNIRRSMYSLIFGSTGSGKSAFVHSAYILNPIESYLKNGRTGIKPKIFLFSMERSKKYVLAKWTIRRIFLDTGIHIKLGSILGWEGFNPLTLDEQDLIKMYEDYMGELSELVDIIEGAQNPTGIYKYVKEYAENNGTIEEIDEHHKIYKANDANELVMPIADHFGLTKREKGYNTKKEAIDKLSEYFQFFRDFYGYSPTGVSQLTRNLSNPMYSKMDSIEPTIDDIKESGRPGEDSDVVISLFDPIRFKTADPDTRYDVTKFQDPLTGAKYFRKITILKSTYSEDDVGVRMAFEGASGAFKELPKASEMEGFPYSTLFNKSYFLT